MNDLEIKLTEYEKENDSLKNEVYLLKERVGKLEEENKLLKTQLTPIPNETENADTDENNGFWNGLMNYQTGITTCLFVFLFSFGFWLNIGMMDGLEKNFYSHGIGMDGAVKIVEEKEFLIREMLQVETRNSIPSSRYENIENRLIELQKEPPFKIPDKIITMIDVENDESKHLNVNYTLKNI